MTEYPYPDLLPQLHVHCTPTEYVQSRYNLTVWDLRRDPKKYARYWQLLPRYLFAVCPVCGQHFSEPGDSYWLDGWGTSLVWHRTLYSLPDSFTHLPYCPHYLGIHRFTHLHGLLPTELPKFVNYCAEVPYVTDWYLPADIRSYVVLHALPICRIEHDRFVPRYTVFSLSYFSANQQAVLARHKARETANAVGDREYYPSTFEPPAATPTPANAPLYDLAAWAAEGRLGWLDLTDTDQPLRIGSGIQLPPAFNPIIGRRDPYVWRRKDHEPLPPDAPAPLPPPPPSPLEQFFRRFR